MTKVGYSILVLFIIIGCRKDDIDLQGNSSELTNPNETYPYYDYEYGSEFIGEYAYFKGTITDTTLGQSLEGYILLNTQGMGLQYVIENGEYILRSARGEVTGFINESYPEPDTLFMDVLDQNNMLVKSIFLLGDTLIYNDTIDYNIQF